MNRRLPTLKERSACFSLRQPAVIRTLRTNDLAEKIDSLGMVVVENGTAPYEQRVKNEVERYAATVKAVGLTVQ